MNQITLNMGLDNGALYRGCRIQGHGGRLNLATAPDVAGPIITANATELAHGMVGSVVVMTGAMAIWAYILVYEVLRGVANAEVIYRDGHNQELAIPRMT